MKDGFFRVMTRSPEVRVADVDFNKKQILAAIDDAVAENASLLVLPELCVTAYSCNDLFLQSALLEAAANAAEEIAAYTAGKNLVVCYSLPLEKDGSLYTAAAVAANGEILGFVPKTHIPNYGEFYEARIFAAGPVEVTTARLNGKEYPFGSKLIFRCKEMPLFKLAVEICEDMFVPITPAGSHVLAGANVVANLSASDEVIGKAQLRRAYSTVTGARGKCAYVYCSAAMSESTAGSVCSAHNLIAEGGYVLAESKPFGDGRAVADLDLKSLEYSRRRVANTWQSVDGYKTVEFSLKPQNYDVLKRSISRFPFVSDDPARLADSCQTAFSIQTHGLAQRLKKTGIQKVLLGVSGGLDSTLALLVACGACDLLGRPHSDVVAVTMPCFGTTSRTKSNAEKMSIILGTDFRTVNIGETVKKHLADIGHDGVTPDVTFENAQARERTQVLMDISNMENGLVLGTGDMSECALGWCTYNGDQMSMYGVNAGLPKTYIRAVVKNYADNCGNDALRDVLYDVVATPVSPELTPAKDGEIAQKTEDIIGPYEAHDFFIYNFIRNGSDPKKILRVAKQAFDGVYTEQQLKIWLETFIRRFFNSQFKRNCSADCPRVGSVDLGYFSFKMTSDTSSALFRSLLD